MNTKSRKSQWFISTLIRMIPILILQIEESNLLLISNQFANQIIQKCSFTGWILFRCIENTDICIDCDFIGTYISLSCSGSAGIVTILLSHQFCCVACSSALEEIWISNIFIEKRVSCDDENGNLLTLQIVNVDDDFLFKYYSILTFLTSFKFLTCVQIRYRSYVHR